MPASATQGGHKIAHY